MFSRAVLRLTALLIVSVVGISCSATTPSTPAAPEVPSTFATSSTTTTTSAEETTDPRPTCPSYSLAHIGGVADDSLFEISGAAWDHRDPNVVWVHEDSANPADVIAIDISTGNTLVRVNLSGHEQYDWEDMSLATSSDGATYLFVGDIGDNLDSRDYLELVRLPVPELNTTPSKVENFETVQLRMPEPANAEALLVDPRSGDVVVVTKSVTGLAQLFVGEELAFTTWNPNVPVPLELVGTLDLGVFGAVLAGDISPDGLNIVLRTPANLWYWHREPNQTIAEAINQNRRCSLPSRFDIYGEAVAIADDGRYVLLGEGQHSPIYLGVPAT